MVRGKVIVEAELRPTEDEEKVLKAISNVFEAEQLEILDQGDYKLIRGYSSTLRSLMKLHRLLRAQAILESARSYMIKRIKGKTLSIMIHKQAAYVNKISFVSWEEESPLGAIKIYVKHRNIEDVIDWLAPQTSRGKPLWEKSLPE